MTTTTPVSADQKYLVMVSSDGDQDQHSEACDHAEMIVGMQLGSEHNAARADTSPMASKSPTRRS